MIINNIFYLIEMI